MIQYLCMFIMNLSADGLPKSCSNKPQISRQSCSSASSTKDFGTNGTANSGAWPAKLYEKDDKISSTPKQKQQHRIKLLWFGTILGTKDCVFFVFEKKRHPLLASLKAWKRGTLEDCKAHHLSHRSDVPRCWPFPSPGFPHVSRPQRLQDFKASIRLAWLQTLKNVGSILRETMGQSIFTTWVLYVWNKHVGKKHPKTTDFFIKRSWVSNIPTTFPFRPGKAMSPIEIMIPGLVVGRHSSIGSWELRCQLDVNWNLPRSIFQQKLDT